MSRGLPASRVHVCLSYLIDTMMKYMPDIGFKLKVVGFVPSIQNGASEMSNGQSSGVNIDSYTVTTTGSYRLMKRKHTSKFTSLCVPVQVQAQIALCWVTPLRLQALSIPSNDHASMVLEANSYFVVVVSCVDVVT